MSSSLEDDHTTEEVDDLHEGEEDDDGLDETSPSKKGKKKRDSSTFRKAPQAPKRFKSSYICFFMAKQSEIKAELGDEANVTSISKRSADMWKHLSPEERAHWDDVAAQDKQRYMNEKATYTGPWQVPWKRVKKDPSAPRRPMSAFLFYSIGKRQQIKLDNADMKNTEISRVLGEMWRALSEEERRPFVEKEKEEREKYKIAIADWRRSVEDRQEVQRPVQPENTLIPDLQPAFSDPYFAPGMLQPFVYPGFPPYVAYHPMPYHFPANGKQPVILGANGMPVYPASSVTSTPITHSRANVSPRHLQPAPAVPAFDDDGSSAINSHIPVSFDYPADQVVGESSSAG